MFFNRKKRKIVNIEGINSELNATKVKETLENLVDISKVKINIKEKYAIISYDHTLDEILITNTIEELGFRVTGIKEVS